MGVYEGRGQLTKSLKRLLLQWGETKLAWDDPISRSFEARYLAPLEADFRSAAAAMDHMAILLQQIQRHCE